MTNKNDLDRLEKKLDSMEEKGRLQIGLNGNIFGNREKDNLYSHFVLNSSPISSINWGDSSGYTPRRPILEVPKQKDKPIYVTDFRVEILEFLDNMGYSPVKFDGSKDFQFKRFDDCLEVFEKHEESIRRSGKNYKLLHKPIYAEIEDCKRDLNEKELSDKRYQEAGITSIIERTLKIPFKRSEKSMEDLLVVIPENHAQSEKEVYDFIGRRIQDSETYNHYISTINGEKVRIFHYFQAVMPDDFSLKDQLYILPDADTIYNLFEQRYKSCVERNFKIREGLQEELKRNVLRYLGDLSENDKRLFLDNTYNPSSRFNTELFEGSLTQHSHFPYDSIEKIINNPNN